LQLRVSLIAAPDAVPQTRAPEAPRPAPATAPESPSQPARPAASPAASAAAEPPPSRGENVTTGTTPEPGTGRLPATGLLDLTGRREWHPDQPARQRRLGEFTPQPPPENWRSGIPYAAEPPGARAPPERIEIVDRWLAADGSHHVLVETAGGEQLCGRAEAWDPLRPLVEPIMMFRICGRGRTTFEWPERYGSAAR
jgi:hypothetical protein